MTSSLSTLLQAIDFAAERHSNQRRKGPSGAPYVNHLIDVATLLATLGPVTDVEVLAAAVLHDVLEDTKTRSHEVSDRFGPRVLRMVQALTDDKSAPRAVRRQHVLDHLPTLDPEIRLIKLADLCSNMLALPTDWSPARQREYVEWSMKAAALCTGLSPELDRLYAERASAMRARCP
jgi:guanosine-3',5'-bis(diphosphate) 3'-pyrophosphohydrolase